MLTVALTTVMCCFIQGADAQDGKRTAYLDSLLHKVYMEDQKVRLRCFLSWIHWEFLTDFPTHLTLRCSLSYSIRI